MDQPVESFSGVGPTVEPRHKLRAHVELLIRASSMGICHGNPCSATYTDALPSITTHGHIDMVAVVEEQLLEDAGHQAYLVRINSWVGRFIDGDITTALVCCVIPPWKAQSIDRLYKKSTIQFVGNIVGLYPDATSTPQSTSSRMKG
jgi:hypothetical protein